MSEYTTRDWQNGKPCPSHSIPYCTPCFKALVASEENPYKAASFDALRENIMKRILGLTAQTSTFYRPRRNFALDSLRKQFAASCQLGSGNFLVVPIEFGIAGDDKTAYKVDEDELRAILTKEHLWDTSMPEWMQHGTTLQLNDEDKVLLREFQLFKS